MLLDMGSELLEVRQAELNSDKSNEQYGDNNGWNF